MKQSVLLCVAKCDNDKCSKRQDKVIDPKPPLSVYDLSKACYSYIEPKVRIP